MKNSYLQSVLNAIENNAAKQQIGDELESHLLDKRDYYLELGYDEKEAIRRADEDMGDPDDCAVPLNAIHRGKSKGCLRYLIDFLLLSFIVVFSTVYSLQISEYDPMTMPQPPTHNAVLDFISLFSIAAVVFLLAENNRRKDSGTSGLLLLFFVLFLAVPGLTAFLAGDSRFRIVPLFQPAFYVASVIITKGVPGYLDSLFAYQPIEDPDFCFAGAVILYLVLLGWAILQFIGITRQENMKNTRVLQIILKWIRRVAVTVLAAYFLLMSACTAYELININNLYAQQDSNWRELIAASIDVDLNRPIDREAEKLKPLFDESNVIEDDSDKYRDIHFWSKNHNITASLDSHWDDNEKMIEIHNCSVTYHTKRLSGVFDAMEYLANYPIITPDEKQQMMSLDIGTPLEDFMKNDLYLKAYSVDHCNNDEYVGGEIIEFLFDIKDSYEDFYLIFTSPPGRNSFTLANKYSSI